MLSPQQVVVGIAENKKIKPIYYDKRESFLKLAKKNFKNYYFTPMSLSKEELIYMSKVSEQTERFEDMLNYMKQVVQLGNELSVEERNLLSVTYKNTIDLEELPGELLKPLNKKKKARVDVTLI